MRRKKSLNSPSTNDNEDVHSPSEDINEFTDDAKFNKFPQSKQKFICALCKKSFSDKNCLKKHIQKIHDVEPGPWLQNSTSNSFPVRLSYFEISS